VTSQGHPYAIFRRAIERKVAGAAWAAAHELHRVSLKDALDLAALVAEQEPERFERLAVRWLGDLVASAAVGGGGPPYRHVDVQGLRRS
jgi:hypothetical protein